MSDALRSRRGEPASHARSGNAAKSGKGPTRKLEIVELTRDRVSHGEPIWGLQELGDRALDNAFGRLTQAIAPPLAAVFRSAEDRRALRTGDAILGS
jgi:hypothetical protein